jgi:uncharacterized membrane protein YesL
MSKFSMSGLYGLTEWITRFAYVNLLWISFSIMGLVIFGFCPATVAMFTILRKWIMGEPDIPVFKTFWNTYKTEFFRSNGLGIVFVLVAGLVFADLYYMRINQNNFLKLSHIPLYLFIFAALMTAIYIFPVYVHYNVRFLQIFKNSFLIMLINPINNIIILLGITAVFFVLKVLPALLFFFGGSVSAGIIMASCYLSFQKIESKKRKVQTT